MSECGRGQAGPPRDINCPTDHSRFGGKSDRTRIDQFLPGSSTTPTFGTKCNYCVSGDSCPKFASCHPRREPARTPNCYLRSDDVVRYFENLSRRHCPRTRYTLRSVGMPDHQIGWKDLDRRSNRFVPALVSYGFTGRKCKSGACEGISPRCGATKGSVVLERWRFC
jgi:hypothetical protein